jgi:hypothetical protein
MITQEEIMQALASLSPQNQGVGGLGARPGGVVSPVTPEDVVGKSDGDDGKEEAWTPKGSTKYTNDGLAHQNVFNPGIGDWFSNMHKWKAMNGEDEGKHIGKGGAADIQALNEHGVGSALGNAWMDNGNPHGQYNQQLYDAMKGYTYKGEDGKQYMINGTYYHGGGYDQEGANTAGDLMFGGVGALGHADKGRQIGEMAYSVTGFKPDWGGDMGAFNGQGFDMYDKDGKYVGGNLPMSMGDDQFAQHALTTALMVASAGLAGGALAGAQAGTGMMGGLSGATNPVLAGSLGEGALAASGNFGALAGTAGAGAAPMAGVGGGGLGSGNGAFVGEGAQSGVPAWDGAGGGAGLGGGGGANGSWDVSGLGSSSSSGSGSSSNSGGLFDGLVDKGKGFFNGLMNDPEKLMKVVSLLGSLGDIGKDPAEGMINPMTGGWNGAIPNYTAMRQQLPFDSTRRPGSAPQRHFTDIQYRAQGGPVNGSGVEGLLKGPGTGQSDHIEATIEGQQPARLAREEFVVPADVVSALGDGSTEAGAEALYQMMDRIRGAAHGKMTQQNPVDPGQVLPA